jgi:soluble lytic murein transglycosylase
MAALGLALIAHGPMADAQTTASIPTAQNAKSKSDGGKAADPKSKDAYAKDTKSKDAKSKDKSSKDAKSKDAKSKDTKSKDAKADPKSGKTASKSSETTVPYNGPASAEDVARVKTAVGLTRQGKSSQATDEQRAISDPAARKLVEWAILRSDNNNADFPRYAAFIAANPSWPAIGALRRRAEAMLWVENVEPAKVRAFFTKDPPLTTRGRFALARALIAQGDRAGAQGYVREAWRNDSFGSDLEDDAMEAFGNLITTADHKARMDMRLYAEDAESAMRSAGRAGGNASTIAKARVAVIKKASNAKALLDAVPAESKNDVGYIFSSAQWLRAPTRLAKQRRWSLHPARCSATIDTDQWWIERRLIARKLLDDNDAKTAYQVARNAVVPSRENYRVEHQFTAGWIALRFLNDPATAQTHFSKIAQGISNPIALARASYWQGRTAEAMGRQQEARGHYQAAAQYPTAYYGQIARAKLGMKDLVLRSPPERHGTLQHEVVRAIDLLYAVGERDLISGMLADLGERAQQDATVLAAVGDIATRNKDARATLLLGKGALGRGLPLDHYAFPVIGIPEYKTVGPAVDLPTVYSIARQESTFNQRTLSTAKAMGLMQVTPEAGRYVSKKFNVSFDAKKLMPIRFTTFSSAPLSFGDLIVDYRGSYILSFAGYNAGRGRVRLVERFAIRAIPCRSDRLSSASPETQPCATRAREPAGLSCGASARQASD